MNSLEAHVNTALQEAGYELAPDTVAEVMRAARKNIKDMFSGAQKAQDILPPDRWPLLAHHELGADADAHQAARLQEMMHNNLYTRWMNDGTDRDMLARKPGAARKPLFRVLVGVLTTDAAKEYLAEEQRMAVAAE